MRRVPNQGVGVAIGDEALVADVASDWGRYHYDGVEPCGASKKGLAK